MKILALDSSAKTSSCAIAEDGRLISLYYQNCGFTHSRTLMPMIEAMLSGCGLNIGEIGLIAVSNGPGSFTGVRIGCALAKGLIWATGKPGCPVSSLEAMAHQALSCGCEYICCVMDARREQVYNALFRTLPQGIERLCSDRAVSLSELETELSGLKKPVYLIGDGAYLCYNHCENLKNLVLAPEQNRNQNAWGVALAAESRSPLDYKEPDPVYLRPSQAERELGLKS